MVLIAYIYLAHIKEVLIAVFINFFPSQLLVSSSLFLHYYTDNNFAHLASSSLFFIAPAVRYTALLVGITPTCFILGFMLRCDYKVYVGYLPNTILLLYPGLGLAVGTYQNMTLSIAQVLLNNKKHILVKLYI